MSFFVVDQQIIAEVTKEITQRVSAEAFGTLDSFCVLFRIHIDVLLLCNKMVRVGNLEISVGAMFRWIEGKSLALLEFCEAYVYV